MKNLIIVLFLVLLIGAGVGYSMLTSPDFAPQIMFKQILKEFAASAKDINAQFKSTQRMQQQQVELPVRFQLPLGESINISIDMQVDAHRVVLKVPNDSPYLTGQQIILEPAVTLNEVRWKCINGDVVARVRSKNCRLGNGETLESMAKF